MRGSFQNLNDVVPAKFEQCAEVLRDYPEASFDPCEDLVNSKEIVLLKVFNEGFIFTVMKILFCIYKDIHIFV